jgi:hypothetical protein
LVIVALGNGRKTLGTASVGPRDGLASERKYDGTYHYRPSGKQNARDGGPG